MANNKTTMQKIPLTGSLDMNTLKTEVKQFEGYNEKNSTVFGGTLSPFYDKKATLTNTNSSYNFYNSNGDRFTLTKEANSTAFHLYKNGVNVNYTGQAVTKTIKLDLDSDTIAAVHTASNNTISLSKSGKILIDNTALSTSFGISDLIEGQIWSVPNLKSITDRMAIVVAVNRTHFQAAIIKTDKTIVLGASTQYSSGTTYIPLITGGYWSSASYTDFYINVVTSTKITTGASSSYTGVDISISKDNVITNSFSNVVRIEDITLPGFLSTQFTLPTSTTTYREYDFLQYCWRYIESSISSSVNVSYRDSSLSSAGGIFYSKDHTISELNFPVGTAYSSYANAYYLDGNLISIGRKGMPINSCTNYGRNMVSMCVSNGGVHITYKDAKGDWYCYTDTEAAALTEDIPTALKTLVFDNKYVILLGVGIYDIEQSKLIGGTQNLDWILSTPPLGGSAIEINPKSHSTGIMFGGGVNAGYTVNNANFIGYISNPTVLSDFLIDRPTIMPTVPDNVQFYCSTGDTVQSAQYYGKDALYNGTTMSVDSNGNVAIPISSNMQLINGYSNNDLAKINDIVYPLIYNNVNTKIYGYYMLSSMENVEGAFSLQGQSYTFDADNIYATTYESGVIQSSNAVCYKSHMTYLGTLPTQAIFYSFFNKTFYSFTGDRILTKMFEANDINEIYYVGQNPASLSLWICTDKGIYVMSDTDTYRLDYVTKEKPYFTDKYAIITTVDGTYTYENDISLYDIGNEGTMVPVKLKTAYYGLGSEQKAVMDCWYIRLYDENKAEGDVKVKVNTITDVTRSTEEKIFHINATDYDDNNIVYLRYQPKYQECTAMQLEMESPIGIYSLSLGVNATDTTAQVSKFNF